MLTFEKKSIWSHQDGSIKNKVMRDPERYIKKDKHLSNSLVRLLHADKSMFLLTNSHYDYWLGDELRV